MLHRPAPTDITSTDTTPPHAANTALVEAGSTSGAAPVTLEGLMKLLARLPGFGPRSARRVVLHLLRHRERLMLPLAQALTTAAHSIHPCRTCGTMDTQNPCAICTDPRRDGRTVCVVEDVADLWALERGNSYRGLYHVLGGTLSMLDGRGPEQLNIPGLLHRVRAAAESGAPVEEVILATNATVEGQATAHYLHDHLAPLGVRITRLAQGVPMGGELDYLDEGTLTAALQARQVL